MPELAEVYFHAMRWKPALGECIQSLESHPATRIYRETPAKMLETALPGRVLESVQTHGKQMLFGFSRNGWLGLHLGMTGELKCFPEPYARDKHDHFVLRTDKHVLIFSDYRQFGRLLWEESSEGEFPRWWRDLPPAVLEKGFTRAAVKAFLQRRAKSPIKAVLLMQEQFPGIGNWMADEILWRARIHPETPAGRVGESGHKLSALFRETLWVTEQALQIIGSDYSDPPASWLFLHRWRDGGICPRTGKPLVRAEVGGRTTCWSPQWQKWGG